MSQKKVFFVEDDEQDMSLLKLYLDFSIPGVTFELMDNALGVLKRLESGVIPEIVFLDLNIPSLSGKDLLKKVRAQYPNCPTLFFIFTSSQRQQDILECYQMGISGYFVKPYDLECFQGVVQVFNGIIRNIEVLSS